MPLTDTAIRNAKPGTKPTKLFDERGSRSPSASSATQLMLICCDAAREGI